MMLLLLYLLSVILACVICLWLRRDDSRVDDYILSFCVACTWPMFAGIGVCILTISIFSDVLDMIGALGARIRKKFN